jgi:exonuclease III
MDLLQWNVNGFRTRSPDLQALIHGPNPAVVYLKETHLRPSDALCLRGYTTHRYDQPGGERASEMTAVLMKDCIYCLPVSFRSPLQVIAVPVHLPNLHFSLCDVNLPLVITARRADLANLLSQLPPPFILLGDFNARHIHCDAALTDDRGTSDYDVCADFDLILLNTGAHTHLCMGSGASFAQDLAFCSPGVAVRLDWSGPPDLHGSDHYPVNTHTSTLSPVVSSPPKWITRLADWAGFSQSLIFE